MQKHLKFIRFQLRPLPISSAPITMNLPLPVFHSANLSWRTNLYVAIIDTKQNMRKTSWNVGDERVYRTRRLVWKGTKIEKCILAPSNGWYLNPKGLLNSTLSHPFGTPWVVHVSGPSRPCAPCHIGSSSRFIPAEWHRCLKLCFTQKSPSNDGFEWQTPDKHYDYYPYRIHVWIIYLHLVDLYAKT